MIKGHGGNIYDLAQRLKCDIDKIIDMSSNVNPLGPMPGIRTFLKNNIDSICALPEVDGAEIVSAFANHYKIEPESVIAGNGTTQFIYLIPYALGSKKVLILGPTYSDYSDACNMHKAEHEYINAKESENFRHDFEYLNNYIRRFDTVFICNPNNPTGVLIPEKQMQNICRSNPETVFIIDESYLSFVRCGEQESMITCDLANVIVLNSMSKIFKIPGLRVGFLISSHKIIKKILPHALPWSVNSLAQVAAGFIMRQEKEVQAFIEKTVKFVENEKDLLCKRLSMASDMKCFPSTTSYVLIKSFAYNAEKLCTVLEQDKILIRNCSNFVGLSDNFIRISLKQSNINKFLAEKIVSL